MRCVLVPPELDRSLEKQIVFIVVPVVRETYHIIIIGAVFGSGRNASFKI